VQERSCEQKVPIKLQASDVVSEPKLGGVDCERYQRKRKQSWRKSF